MSAQQPLVSVILPTFQRAATIAVAIESVLTQSYSALELIVVDDASTDETEAIVRGFDDARISYLRHENNRGGGAARNTGLERARGEFLAFQDSDDRWISDKLERQIAFLHERPEVDLVWSPYRRGDSGTLHPAEPERAPRGNILSPLLRANFIGTPTIVARRGCYERSGGFDERLPRFQDWEWMIRVAAQAQVDHLNDPLVDAGWADNNITGGHDAALVEAERILLEKHRETFAADSNATLAYRLWHYAHVCFMAGQSAAGLPAMREAQQLDYHASWTLTALLGRFPSIYRWLYRMRQAARTPTA